MREYIAFYREICVDLTIEKTRQREDLERWWPMKR